MAIEWDHRSGLAHKCRPCASTSTASGLLCSPLYKGRVVHSSRGVSTEGKYEPNVAPPLWAIVERVLAGVAITAAPHVGADPAYPLKGMVICGECGKPAPASTMQDAPIDLVMTTVTENMAIFEFALTMQNSSSNDALCASLIRISKISESFRLIPSPFGP